MSLLFFITDSFLPMQIGPLRMMLFNTHTLWTHLLEGMMLEKRLPDHKVQNIF